MPRTAREKSISKIASMDSLERNIELKNIKDRTGASNRQLARVLNIGRGILDRIK
jgi:putative transposase